MQSIEKRSKMGRRGRSKSCFQPRTNREHEEYEENEENYENDEIEEVEDSNGGRKQRQSRMKRADNERFIQICVNYFDKIHDKSTCKGSNMMKRKKITTDAWKQITDTMNTETNVCNSF